MERIEPIATTETPPALQEVNPSCSRVNTIEIWKYVNITSSTRKVYPGSYLYKVVESDELPEINQSTNQGRVLEVHKLEERRYKILFLE